MFLRRNLIVRVVFSVRNYDLFIAAFHLNIIANLFPKDIQILVENYLKLAL